MLRATLPLHKMASTHGGMRRILKKRLPVQRYIELAVKAGSYKTPSTRPHYLGLQDVPEPKGFLSPREREERLKLRRGIIDYPAEYEILSLNPPLPTPPRTPVRVRKKIIAEKRRHLEKLKKERKKKGLTEDDQVHVLPSLDRLVKSYLRRHDDMVRGNISPSQSRQQEEYYSNLLLGRSSSSSSSNDSLGGGARSSTSSSSPSSLQTAMGRKSMLVENAYAFALRQQQIMLQSEDNDVIPAKKNGKSSSSNDSNKVIMTEQESIERVEQLLREEARANRQRGRTTAESVKAWRESQGQDGAEDTEEDENTNAKKSNDDDDKDYDSTTLPSILHDRPRAVRALNIWSARLASIPYSRWTIGASTALDHWIAREVLQMEEQAWQQVLEGGGTDAYLVGEGMGDILPGGESKRGLMDRMRDIVLVRGALFPETRVERGGDMNGLGGNSLKGDLDDGLLSSGSDDSNATEKSIDDLLATLGELNDDDDGTSWKFDDEDDKKGEVENAGEDDEKMSSIIDELQVWRGRNASSPFKDWDMDRKNEFDQWMEKYINTFYPDADATTVDMEATRASLLAARPTDSGKTKEFWSKITSETDAESFLMDYRASAKEKLNALWALTAPNDEEKQTQTELEAILSVPFDVQLDKLVNMGTLRPILDDYASGKERKSFLEKYAPIFLEGMEMEHLVPDPDGPIGLDDLSSELREELSSEWTPSTGLGLGSADGQRPRFAIRMVAYGSDEFGTSRSERARELFRLWNEHKANRARFEESLFKKGHLRLEEDGVRIPKRGKKKD